MADSLSRRSLLATSLLLGLGCARKTPPRDRVLRVITAPGTASELFEFVAALPLGIEFERLPFEGHPAARQLLLDGDAELGAFETADSLRELGPDVERYLSVTSTVTEVYGFYSRAFATLSEVPNRTRVVFAREFESRALYLLRQYALLGYPEELGPKATLKDITHNPRQLQIELASESALRPLEGDLVGLDFTAARNQNLAPARHALAAEDGYGPFAQVLTVKASQVPQHLSWHTEIREAYRTSRVKRFILEQFEGSVRRAF